jgi:endonuclease YncB( thermonuclease family)
MPLPLIVLAAAAASFACEGPSHHDGDNLRCANVPGSMRLQGIDAPEMPGACGRAAAAWMAIPLRRGTICVA